MFRRLLLCLFLLNVNTVYAQNQNITVYSIVGKVSLQTNNRMVAVKPYQELSPSSYLKFTEKSTLYFIQSNGKMSVFRGIGTFRVGSICKLVNKSSSEWSNAMSLVIHHFIEKGKSRNEKYNYESAGVVTRGGDVKLVLFPVNKTILVQQRAITPVFSHDFTDTAVNVDLSLIVNDQIIKEYQIKKGQSILLPESTFDNEEVFLKIKIENNTQLIRLLVADKSAQETFEKELKQLESDFGNPDDPNLLLAQAYLSEYKGYYLDAIDFYNKLITNFPNDTFYVEEKTRSIYSSISQ